MHHVIFEVLPGAGCRDAYLAIAARLKPLLEVSAGCVALERYDADDGKGMLSLQQWTDEAALARWRAEPSHCQAMATGRARLFEHYRLRVAQALRAEATRASDAALPGRPEAGFDEPLDNDAPRALAVLQWSGAATTRLPAWLEQGVPARRYTAILDPDRRALVTATAPAAALAAWCARLAPLLRAQGSEFALSLAAVRRDYGPNERAEAPA